jgi:serine/threonine protein kinase
MSSDDVEEWGHFFVIRSVNSGGMGTIAEAFNRRAGRICALKRNTKEENRARFDDEQRLATELRHPNLVPVLDVGVIDGVPYVEMDFVGGKSLETLSGYLKRLSEPVVRAILRQVCGALDYAHSRKDLNFIHRDISPGNVMVSFSGNVVLLDYGLSWFNQKRYRTAVGKAPGTPGFASPEQLFGKPVDRRSDLYSLAAVAWTLLTGRELRPRNFKSEDVVKAIPSIRSINADVSEELDAIIAKALRINPDERFQSAAELAQSLGGNAAPADAEILRSFLREHFPKDEPNWRVQLEADAGRMAALHTERASSSRRPRRIIVMAAVTAVFIGIGFGGYRAIRRPRAKPLPPPQPTAPSGVVQKRSTIPPPVVEDHDSREVGSEAIPESPPPSTGNPPAHHVRPTDRKLPAAIAGQWADAKREISAKRFLRGRKELDGLKAGGYSSLAELGAAKMDYEREQYQAAVDGATRALSHNVPAKMEALLLRAEAELRLGNGSAAAKDFGSALKIDPHSLDAKAGLRRAEAMIPNR